MKNTRILSLAVAAFSLLALQAREVPGLPHSTPHPNGASQNGTLRAAPCSPASAIGELDLNNVRARIENGGTLWENRSTGLPAYEVPRTPDNSGPKALFAGALWMGGVAPDSTLKLAAVRFRQIGNDYYPGPLTAFDTLTQTGDASTDAIQCNKYDKLFKTERRDAAMQNAYYLCLADPSCNTLVDFPDYATPAYFFDWPAHGDESVGQDYNLAPYNDFDDNNVYEPENGDSPGYDLQGVIDCKTKKRTDPIPLFGDQNIWWVFNDKGNAHTESGGQPIGMEIRAQAFAFSTNDEVNNMTFYNYVLINQGTQTLYQTYFGQWVDVDLGGANDDYVGCDVSRGLGYGYNGDAVDENDGDEVGYGGPVPPPPAVGVDFFEGPYQDADDLDNPLTLDCQNARDSLGIPYGGIGIGYGDGVPDNERFGMRAFVYHNNTGGPTGDPSNAIAYYNFLRGIWGDNTPMTYGGSGYNPGGGGVRASYMFPGLTDVVGWGTNCQVQPDWSEVTAGNAPADRRFIQSAGPFTLRPGQFNNITVGVVWARSQTGNVQSSVNLMMRADDKAQALFDNCFKILNGPDAPTLTIQELDKELILYITNPQTSNNFNENYAELDATIPQVDTAGNPVDRFYRFEGYQIYQVKDASVGPDQVRDPGLAQLVAQVDKSDSVGQIINWIQDPDLNLAVPMEMVNGGDTGIVHTFRIQKDRFSTTDPSLKNFQTYYFMAIAYSYNNYQKFEQTISGGPTGQAYPYLAGRKSPTGSIRAVAGIPHKAEVENGGTQINSQYGDGFQITRIEGQGNGGQVIELQQSTLDGIVASPIGRLDELPYVAGLGPVNIKVVDPLKVPAGNFELWLKDTTSIPIPTAPITYKRLQDASWMIVHLTDNPTSADTVRSTRTIQVQNEDIIPQWGMSVTMTQIIYPGDLITNFLGSSKVNTGDDWLGGIPDVEGELVQNWIRSGQSTDATALGYPDYTNDPDQQYENVLGGTWAPWQLVGDTLVQPGALESTIKNTQTNTSIQAIPSIQVVITPDKSKWSRCIVVEESDAPQFTIPANTKKLHLRNRPSIDKNGRPYGSDGANNDEAGLVSQTGMSWFPGFAVDLETGERLNLFFGENSFLGGGAGNDMIWNPSSQLYNDGGFPVFGGQHWIYVCYNVKRISLEALAVNRMPQYDQCAFARTAMDNPSTIANVYGAVGWVGSALLNPGFSLKSMADGLVPSEVRLRMNVSKPYNLYTQPYAGYTPSINPVRNGGLPLYTFNTAGQAPISNDAVVGKSQLDNIGVVPNPYYAYSGYETGRLDNRVKFINLPKTCTVSIYTVSGTLVRKYRKDNELTYLDWDLKNAYNVPISGGTYLCHIDAPGLGERVIKWFGVMRPIDLQNF